MNLRPVILTMALVMIISALTVLPFADFGSYDWQIIRGEDPEAGDPSCPLPSPPGDAPGGQSLSESGHGGSGTGQTRGDSGDGTSDNGGGTCPDNPPVIPKPSNDPVPVPEFPSPAVPAAFIAGILGMVLLARGR
jgi:hypothetical protein